MFVGAPATVTTPAPTPPRSPAPMFMQQQPAAGAAAAPSTPEGPAAGETRLPTEGTGWAGHFGKKIGMTDGASAIPVEPFFLCAGLHKQYFSSSTFDASLNLICDFSTRFLLSEMACYLLLVAFERAA